MYYFLADFLTYQYFIMVVPTKVDTYSHRGSTFQYSVAEQHREISHEKVIFRESLPLFVIQNLFSISFCPFGTS